jgi:4-aminobutyrate aminotransferase
MTNSHDDLLSRHRAVMPAWMTLYYDQALEIVGGEGRRLTGGDGRVYLDFFAGILTNSLGYGLPELTKAVEEQLRSGVVHTSTAYLGRRQVEYAERVAELSGIPDAKVFFVNSGTEANEAALLLATAYRRSNQVLALRNSYHGRAFATVAVTGNRSWGTTSLSPVHVSYVHGGYRYRSPFRHLSDADYIKACVDDLRDVLQTMTSGDVACMIAEPIQGVGGFTAPPDGLFAAMKEVLDEYGILFITDEVQTGWGRTGEHFWGYQAHGIVPDILTFAKGAAGGLPIGGVVARAEIMDALTANSLSTFGGNPLTMAAAQATLDYILEHDLQANAAKLGGKLLAGLRACADDLAVVGDVRGKGLMIGVELVEPGGTEPSPRAASMVMEECRRGGLLVGKGGLYGNVIRIGPPLTVTEDEIEEGLGILSSALSAVDQALR